MLVSLLDNMLSQSVGSQALLAATMRTAEAFQVFQESLKIRSLDVHDITSAATGRSTTFQHLIIPQPVLPVRLLRVTCSFRKMNDGLSNGQGIL